MSKIIDLNKPNTIVIGPMKSATTWIDQYFRARSDICLPHRVKETFFFDRNYHRGLDWYLNHFSGKSGACVRRVEVAPSYFHSINAPVRMRETLGETRLVVVLRDPVTRAFSHYLHLMRYGFIKSDLRQAVISYPEILSASAYATCLKRWFDVFDAESILILYQYDLVERPNVFVNTLCSYLELDYVSYDSVSGKRVNEAALPSNRILAAAGQKVADTLRSVGLYSIVNLAKSLGLKNVFFGRPGERMLPVISEEDRAWLSMMLAQEISDLEVMLGIDLTRWKGV